MKITRNWIILIIIMVAVSVFLFISGRQHTVYIENKYKDIKSIDVSYSVDGEKIKKIKANKKKVELVKGRSHNILVEFKGENGDMKKIEKSFTLGATENIEINIPLLINNNDNWINRVK